MKNKLVAGLLCLLLGCSASSQSTPQQPKGIICHVQGVPNACYVFTPKEYEIYIIGGSLELVMTDEDNQETRVYGMSCLVMPREAIGDGACAE